MSVRGMLPYQDVDSSLRAMAGSAEGFGRHAIGGLHDDGPGSLRQGCRTKEPLWIVFQLSGTILLSSYLSVSSYTTIDGRGQRIKLTGKGLRLKECQHIIVCNLEFEGGTGHDVDGIQIKPNSTHIWIDRCTLRDYDDGLIDITRQSTDITVSRLFILHIRGTESVGETWSIVMGYLALWQQHDKTMLIGADPSHVGDRCIRVTIHHCFFDGTRQRQPRVRFGKVHLYNNYTRNWGVYAVCASVESQIYSQCNVYEAGTKKKTFEFYTEKAADKEVQKSGLIISEGDMFLNGAQPCLLTEKREETMFHPSEYYPTWTMEAAHHSLRDVLQLCTGWQSICRPIDHMSFN
ncbi:putative pectate lyase 4, partial [Mucuna pruriens]